MDGYKVLLDATPEQKKSQRSTWSQLQAIADMKFTYVAACQMYGEQKRQGHHSATEILKLMLKYVFNPITCLAVHIPVQKRLFKTNNLYESKLSLYHSFYLNCCLVHFEVNFDKVIFMAAIFHFVSHILTR